MTPAQARENAGLDLNKAARLAGVGPRYLRKFEQPGNAAPWCLAERLSVIYNCSVGVFLHIDSAPSTRKGQ